MAIWPSTMALASCTRGHIVRGVKLRPRWASRSFSVGWGQQDYLDLVDMVPPSFFAKPTAADLASFPTFRAYMATQAGVPFPEAELRGIYQAKSDAGVGPGRNKPYVVPAIQAGEQKYTSIRVPVRNLRNSKGSRYSV
jgi:hypothetical protein